MSDKKKIELRITLEDEFLKHLEQIKQYYGILNNTEIIRFLIKDKHRDLFKKDE